MTVVYGKKGIASFPWSIQVQHSGVCIFHGWGNNRLTDLNHALNRWLTDSPSLHLSEAVDESTIRSRLATLFGSYKDGIYWKNLEEYSKTYTVLKGSCPRKIGNEAREIWQAVRWLTILCYWVLQEVDMACQLPLLCQRLRVRRKRLLEGACPDSVEVQMLRPGPAPWIVFEPGRRHINSSTSKQKKNLGLRSW